MRNVNSSVGTVGEFVTPPGSRFHVQYEPRFDGKTLSVVPVGKYDIQEQIEAYAPYCDITYMLSRLKVGDYSVLSNRVALYGDFSGMPDNPVDAINLIHSAEGRFATLSVEERQAYNNDYRVWLAHLMADGGNLSDSAASNSVSIESTVKEGVQNES